MPNNRIAVKSGGGEIVEGPAYHVDLDEANVIAAYWLIMSDLQFVGMACKKLVELRESDERDLVLPRCLWTGAIEAYARCFATGRRFRLNRDNVFAGQPAELKHHDEFLTYRNEFTAHPVSGLEQAVAGIRVDDEGKRTVGVVGVIANAPPSTVVKVLGHTSEVVWNWVKRKGMEVENALLTRAIPLSDETITSNPPITIAVEIWPFKTM